MSTPSRPDESLDDAAVTPLTRRSFLQGAGVAGGALLLPSLLAGPAGAATRLRTGATKDIGTITWAFPEAITRMSLIHLETAADENAIASTIECLLTYDTTGRLVPNIATSWSQPTPTTYVFKIRQGVKFSDGTSMTMADILASANAVWKEPGSVFAGLLQEVKGFSVHGNQLRVKLKAPVATFKYLATFIPVYKASELQAHSKILGTPKFLGTYTGPYSFESFVPGQSVTLVRNPHYWGKRPAADKIVYQVFKDDASERLAVQSGQLDGAFRLGLTDLKSWESLSDARVIQGGAPVQLYYVSFDNKQAPWNDPHVRRAIAHCCDKVGIAKAIFSGNAIPATTYPPPSEWTELGLTSDQALAAYKHIPDYALDLSAAKAELAKSRYPKGVSGDMFVPGDSDPENTLIAQTIASKAKSIGINLTVKQQPDAEFNAQWLSSKKNTGCRVIRNGPTFLEASDFPRIMLLKAYDIPGSYNSANYYNSAIEKIMARVQASRNPAQRREDLLKVLHMVHTDQPYVPLVWGGGAMAINKKYNYVGFHPWAYLIQEWAEKIVAA